MTPLFKKLNLKLQKTIVVHNSPKSFDTELEQMKDVVHISKSIKKNKTIEFVLCFVTEQKDVDACINEIYPKAEGDAVIWFCYPKASSKKYTCTFNRDTGWGEFGKNNLEPVRGVAIDEDWSALRFRKVEYIKKLTRNESFTLSEAGKKKALKSVGKK